MQHTHCRPSLRLVLAAPLVLAAAGCDLLFDPTMCTLEARPGITVAIVDSVTGTSAVRGSRTVARSGAFEHLSIAGDDPAWDGITLVSLATERPGTYTVTVSKDGYRDWIKTNVKVVDGECHVETVSLTAKLQR